MNLNSTEIIGFVASCISTLSFVPQVYKVYREKKVEGISKLTFFSLFSGGVSWILYGFLIGSNAVVITNSLISIMAILIFIAKLKYQINEGE